MHEAVIRAAKEIETIAGTLRELQERHIISPVLVKILPGERTVRIEPEVCTAVCVAHGRGDIPFLIIYGFNTASVRGIKVIPSVYAVILPMTAVSVIVLSFIVSSFIV